MTTLVIIFMAVSICIFGFIFDKITHLENKIRVLESKNRKE